MTENPYDGIDFTALTIVEEYPDQVKGRVLQIDADFLAYQCSYEREGEDKTLTDMYHNVAVIAEHMQMKAGAEKYVLHLTPNTSNKGGRYDQAIQKQYQGNRDNKSKPRYLHLIRQYMHEHLNGVMHEDCEADDGMAMAQYDAIAKGQRNLSVIASMDKDLAMVPGLHFDWSREVVEDTLDDFGHIYLNDKGKLKGLGQKFFWAQMLMGDTADNIQGLPTVAGKYLNAFDPTKKVTGAKAVLKDAGATDQQRKKAQAVLDGRKPKTCGPAMAFKLLENCNTNRACFSRVLGLYRAVPEFKHWSTGALVKPDEVFLSEARLLWMRRSHDYNDVIKWMKGL